MSNTFITVIAIMACAVVMFVFPLMATANQNDSITQTSIQSLVSEFVNTASKEGKITKDNYDEFVQKLYATGNSYDIELEVQVLDDNPGKKGQNINVIGENIYYSVYTNTIIESLDNTQNYMLKQGDYFIVTVNNTNVTMGTKLKNFIYSVVGKDTIAIQATATSLVTTNGT